MKIKFKQSPRGKELPQSAKCKMPEKSFKDPEEDINLTDTSISEKAFLLCKRVKENFGDDADKFSEFLAQLHMFSQQRVDLTEFLNLVDNFVRADERLMNDLEDFLENCGRAQSYWSRKCKRLN
ncbi:hypothetical protein PRUPE_1G009100 [Prunus persica]|uniref:Uncharacterized protein n=1 Tax=Prunus persica TaxID=3760 RepID=A0A251QQW0_PRUPE|nr:hypothetical protein PRUPE_1G009100 [Prunus persica]